MQTNPEHEGQQVRDLADQDPAPPFQAGHAGSIPVTRSSSLTSTNLQGNYRSPESATSHFVSTHTWPSVGVEYREDTKGHRRSLTTYALPRLEV